MTDGSEVIKTTLTPIVPEELHGFAVTVGLGPYPPDRPVSHRKAMYAELIPLGANQEKLRRAGRARILGVAPLTPQAVLDIEADPHGELAEQVAVTALAQASRLARLVDQA